MKRNQILGCGLREDRNVMRKLTRNYNEINMQYVSGIHAK